MFSQLMPTPIIGATDRPVEVEFINSGVNSGGLSAYTFSSLGQVEQQYILVGVASRVGSGGSSRRLIAVTVNGVAATIIENTVSFINSGYNITAFALVSVHSSSIDTVSLNFNGSMVRAGIAVWGVSNIKDINPLDVSTGTTTATTYLHTINAVKGGAIIAVSYVVNPSGDLVSSASSLTRHNGVLDITSSRSAVGLTWVGMDVDENRYIRTNSSTNLQSTSVISLR